MIEAGFEKNERDCSLMEELLPKQRNELDAAKEEFAVITKKLKTLKAEYLELTDREKFQADYQKLLREAGIGSPYFSKKKIIALIIGSVALLVFWQMRLAQGNR